MKPLQQGLVALIQRYQRAGGGQHFFSVACNFSPSCSEYTRQAILDQGVVRGLRLGWQRVCRCTHTDLAHKLDEPYPGDKHGSV